VEHGTAFWFSAAQQQEAYAQAADDVRGAIEDQLNAMGGMEEAQARASISQKNYNDAVADFPAGDPRIKDAYDVWQRDTKALAGLQGDAAKETDKHKTAIEQLADAANKAANTQLDYEDAVKKVRDAEKAAGEELKKNGANSDEYQTKVRDVARAMLGQAEAARKVAEANGTAADGQAAYVNELLKLNDGSKSGRDALIKLASGMTDADRAAYNAAASASGLNTEIIKLPNGKEIKVVVAGDTSALPTVEQQIKSITEKQYIGEIKFQGNATLANGTVMESVRFANDQTGIITLNANGEPVTAVVNGQKYLIDHSTGVMTIAGEPKPGIDSLNGFIYTVNSSTGVASIDGNPTLGLAQLTSFVGKVNTAKGTATIDGDPTLANGATTQAIKFANGSYGTVTINGNEEPVNGKITASVRYADGSVGTIQLNANDANVKAAQQNAQRTINAPVVFDPNTAEADRARARLAAELKVKVTFTSTGEVKGRPDLLGAARGAVVAPGGAQLFADGGVSGKPLTFARSGVAQVAPPNTWRVFGDRSDVNESYIPWKRGDARANRLLDITARALGRTVLPMAIGGIVRFAAGGVSPAAPATSSVAASAAPGPALDDKYAKALADAAAAGQELAEAQQLVTDTATTLGAETGLTTEQVAALTAAAASATSAEQAYQVGLQAVQLAQDTVTLAAQTRTAAEQVATDTTAVALGQANAYTGGLTTLGAQAGGATTGGITTLTGAVSADTGAQGTALGQAQAYTGGLSALGGQAGGGTTAGVQALTGAVNASGGATVTATGQAQGYTGQLTTLGGQAGGATAAGLQQAATAAQAQGTASAAAGGQAAAQSGQLNTLAGSATTAARELQGVATAVNNLPDGDFTVTANGRMGAITGTPTVAKATGGVLPGYTPGRDVHDFYSPTAGRLLLSGGEAVMRPEWTAAVGPGYVDAANQAAREGRLRDFLARTAPREGQTGGDGSMLATGGVWGPKPKEQRYAMGGIIPQGNPFPPMPTDLWKQLSEQMATAMTPVMQQAVKDAEIEAAGGDALAWARTQVGKPYIWGGVGPAGYDCSGFMSAILNVLNGRPPHSRVGSTASFPWAGFSPGIGGRFSIGAFKGDPGHMAGTLCIVGSMLIDGPNGPRRIDEIQPGEWVWSFDEGRRKPHQVVKAWFTARQPVFEVRMSKGRSVTGSANHPFLVARLQEDCGDEFLHEDAEWTGTPGRQPYGARGRDACAVSTCSGTMWTHHLCRKHQARFVKYGDPRVYTQKTRQRWATEWVRLDGLREGDFVVRSRATEDVGTLTTLPNGQEVTAETAWLIGHLVGDGALTGENGKIRVSVYKDHYRDRVLSSWKALTGRDGKFYGYERSQPPVTLYSAEWHGVFRQMGMCVKGTEKRVPTDVWLWPRHLQRAFLDGYADADGTYPGDDKPYTLRRYTSASKRLVAEVRAMHIAHGDGVSNVQHRVRDTDAPGTFRAGESWGFDVYAGVDDNGGVKDRTGLAELRESWQGDYTFSRVQAVIPKGEEDTYDITVEGAHAFSVDGIQLHNSGTNVESSGSVGVRVGGGARGADNGMFTIRAHVADGGILPHFDSGGVATGKGLMLKDTIRPERVLDPRTTVAFERLANGLGAGPERVALGRSTVTTPAAAGSNLGAVVSAIQGEVSRQISEIRAVANDLARRPAVTVNDTSGNPVEAGRAAALAYRMAR
jgi:acylphosphatase